VPYGTKNINLSEDLIVMLWICISVGNNASYRSHHDFIGPNNSGCYIDYPNCCSFDEPGNLGVITLDDVAQYSPIYSDMREKITF